MISPELAAFLQEGIAMSIGTRNARLEPDGARVVAVSVDADGRHVVAYVPEPAARRVVPDLEDNGHAALVFARPPDERACQLKGTYVRSWPATEDERAIVQTQWGWWVDRLEMIGIERPTMAEWITWPCVAIRVRVTAIFNQTPGPDAGAPIA
jgi:hypothetical protein